LEAAGYIEWSVEVEPSGMHPIIILLPIVAMRGWRLLSWSLGCLVFGAAVLGAQIPLAPLDDAPRITRTTMGLQGDPINVGLVGTKSEIVAAMLAAKWLPADPLTLASSLKLLESVVLRCPDETAPVSHLYLWKRKEDLAFEQQFGKDASRRHHVRFWQSTKLVDGRPLWLGAASFDAKIGLSHKTGVPTHHIDANIDAERDTLMRDLAWVGRLQLVQAVEGFHHQRDARNGAGDPYHTDGRFLLGIVNRGAAPGSP
jgi:hypothetical protein